MSSESQADPGFSAQDSAGQSNTASNATFPKAKLSAFARFKTLSGFKSTPEPPFPPTSWELSGSPSDGSGASDWDQIADYYKAGLENWREGVKAINFKQENVKNMSDRDIAQPSGEMVTDGPVADQDSPDTRTLAMKIKALIDEKFTFAGKKSQSAPATPGPATTTPAESSPPTPVQSCNAHPSVPATPPAGETSNPISSSVFGGLDATLAKFLSSEAIMNGEVGKGFDKGRESVWAMLDKLGAMAGASDPNKAKTDKGKGRAEDVQPPGDTSTSEVQGIEEDGIMMCTPLQPTQELPEIAESELEYVDDEQMVAGDGQRTPTIAVEPNSNSPPTPVTSKSEPLRPATRSKTKRTFYPSPTKLSLQVTWWGYRLFLPPPIIAQLSSAHIAAAKRGAMITAALTWLIDQIPLMVIPPQMRASVMMLKRISPYLGYVGAFVAWSWGRVQAKDQGNGVVLTATWLLPIAILPAAWDFEVHGRPREHEGVTRGGPAAQLTGTADAAALDNPSASTSSSSIPVVNQSSGDNGASSESTTPSAEKPSFMESATRRWNSMRKMTLTKEKTE
ncbi:hypothetical protein F5878DRAFT_599122 [Lentinula raphanica]|uniref:Uncharacterized protein n=1 Tax=Lentinula raphanica TaxID=153919 RepID=A0AA38PMA8_9AGAR|nr:hypothetical protein F5878DRAFT_599122 [Lentinula raphanica]